MYAPTYETFEKLAREGNLIPLYREILADVETPVSVFMKLRNSANAFLLESVEGGEKWGRYTFLGADPRLIFRVSGPEVFIEEQGKTSRYEHDGNPLGFLKEILQRYSPVSVEGLPRFYGGAVGFLGYEMVHYFERLPASTENDLYTDEAVFLVTDTLILFDRVRHTIKVVACVHLNGQQNLEPLYSEAVRKIEALVDLLQAPALPGSSSYPSGVSADFTSNMTPEAFRKSVERAKEYIRAGDVIQVVLSQRFSAEAHPDPIDLYRALRYTNPSPYLFFLKMGDMALIGSSPEVMVRLEEGIVELKPIAGTRPRGKTEQEDRRLADELLEDPKERAEHVMLVDLGRNDLGRVARTGSVQLTQLMVVERYSHVMHIVSSIQAQLDQGLDAFDVLKAVFPAGTLTGAPKIRAMEIIDELEPVRRGPYGGAVGYFSFSGNMDLCITIRTILLKGGKMHIQAGAGIVADSDFQAEYQETVNKAAGMRQAVELALSGFEIRQNSSGVKRT
ncbi:MAG: Anthranilate synthase component 1 [Syntrophus sp. PtaU1.Bin208]|nr:MAG: Anthranilate synthase component 1 [Syntrophus sp. PtaU1.Bin208]